MKVMFVERIKKVEDGKSLNGKDYEEQVFA